MRWLLKILKLLFWLGLTGGLLAAVAVAVAYYYIEPDLPDIDNLRDVRLQVPLKVFSRDGELIAEFGEQRRNPLDFEDVPERMVQAFLAAEDDNFFGHPGVDYRGLLRAGIQLALTGQKKQGGSTITMQVARNFYLTRQKTYTRKIAEIFLALRIERELSKGEILQLYLNKIYLGHRAYGVGAAAQVYYGKTVDQLDLAQTAMIAGLPKAPSSYNPIANPPRAIERRNYVLGRMLELGFIDEATHGQASAEPVTASRYAPAIELDAPYLAEMVRSEMVERYAEDAYTGGYRVTTTVGSERQRAATRAVRGAIDAYGERHGYHGPELQLDAVPEDSTELDRILADRPRIGDLRPAVVISVEKQQAQLYAGDGEEVLLTWEQMKWARDFVSANRRGPQPKKAADIMQAGDIVRLRAIESDGKPGWRLGQPPQVTGALVALAPQNGAIEALVGGYDFYYSKFNRATQAERQPGSGFKAFIYSAALANGFTPASLVNDAPVVFDDPSLEGAWRPENYSGKFFGPTRLRYALTKSRNLVSIRLLRSIGIETALAHIEKFGFDPKALPHNLSLALGSANVTPLQMATGYAVLANGGFRVEPYLIERIEQDGVGEVFTAQPLTVCEQDCEEDRVSQAGDSEATNAETAPMAPRAIDERNRFLMYSMMQDVIRQGTATKARELGRKDLAGKTGTTNDQRDAWFNGFNNHLVANVWIGFDDNSKLGRGEVGGRAALPAWIEFMRTALKGVPDEPLTPPEGIVTVNIDRRSGEPTAADNSEGLLEVFREENVPGAESLASEDGEERQPGEIVRVPVAAPPPTQELF